MTILFTITSLFFASFMLPAQRHTPLPHGMTFGQKVNPLDKMPATDVEAFMGKKTRISTTITGTVLKIDTPKGGWFEMEAGHGRIIKVHFKNYNVTLPLDLKGRNVMIEGVAQKLFIADDMQHFAGDTVKGKKQHKINVNPKQRLSFEATGLVVD
jgi:hypothetical protein